MCGPVFPGSIFLVFVPSAPGKEGGVPALDPASLLTSCPLRGCERWMSAHAWSCGEPTPRMGQGTPRETEGLIKKAAKEKVDSVPEI